MKTRVALGAILSFAISCTSAHSPPVVRAGSALPAASAAATVPPPPTARTEEVNEEVSGVRISDPYRWMEKSSDELHRWIEAQDSRARVTLAGLPHRDEIRADIETADRGVTRVSVVRVTGGEAKPRIFLLKRAPEDQTQKLWVRDGWDGKDRLLVDAAARGTSDIHYSIDYANPSDDGRYVAYGISQSGSEDSVVEITRTGLDSGEVRRKDAGEYKRRTSALSRGARGGPWHRLQEIADTRRMGGSLCVRAVAKHHE